jgi:hypothetical protein
MIPDPDPSIYVLTKLEAEPMTDRGFDAHRRAFGVVNMEARCGGYAVRPIVRPLFLHWDGCMQNRNNGMLAEAKRIGVEA